MRRSGIRTRRRLSAAAALKIAGELFAAFHDLLNAFAQVRQAVPEARLIMVGPHPDPDYAQTVQDRVTSLALGDSVDIVGFVDNDRLRHEIASARAVVLFSREETAPTIIAQAMAAGKPVVAARVGGVPEMVNDGESGFVVESED